MFQLKSASPCATWWEPVCSHFSNSVIFCFLGLWTEIAVDHPSSNRKEAHWMILWINHMTEHRGIDSIERRSIPTEGDINGIAGQGETRSNANIKPILAYHSNMEMKISYRKNWKKVFYELFTYSTDALEQIYFKPTCFVWSVMMTKNKTPFPHKMKVLVFMKTETFQLLIQTEHLRNI